MRAQLRPRNGDTRFYSPDRDLAYTFVPALREAVAGLDQAAWTPELTELVARFGLTEHDLGTAAQRLAEAAGKFVGDAGVREPLDALQAAGFLDCPVGARTLLFARLGEVMLGGFFVAIRDVAVAGEAPPQSREIADLIAAGRAIVQRAGPPAVSS